MAHLFRLIFAFALACIASASMADGGSFPATSGSWNTSSCSQSIYPSTPYAADKDVTESWACRSTSNPNLRECGYNLNAPAYGWSDRFYSMCYQPKSPDTCPAGSTISTSATGESSCTCGAGLRPYNGQCVAAPSCPAGQHEEGGACVPDNCKPDETRINGVCVKEPDCPIGQTRIDGVCKPNKCQSGTSAGDYTDISDTVTYLCEMSNGLNCQVRVKPTICVRFDGQETCSGPGTFTGATCSGGNGGTGGGSGPSDSGGSTGGSGNGGTGNGGTGSGGTGTGGGGSGTGTGGGGTGTGGSGTGSGGSGSGTGDGGSGTGTPPGSGSGSGPGSGLPSPNPKPPQPDGTCPAGYHKSGNLCIQDPAPPDGDGKCPPGSVKVRTVCVFTEPAGGGGNGNGDGDGGKGGFGGSCMAGFACDGDAIQCAIAREQYTRNCKLFDDKSPESDLYYANKGKEGNQTGDLPGNETISLQGRIDTSDALGGGSCFGDLGVTVWGTSVTLPLSSLCQYLAMLGNILVAVSMLMAARIVTRG